MKRHIRLLMTGVLSFFFVSVYSQVDLLKTYSVKFHNKRSHLSKEAREELANAAEVIKKHPDYKFITRSCSGGSRKRLSKIYWDRVNNVISYLTKKKGINAERFIFVYDGEPDNCNNIELQLTNGLPPADPPSHPNIKQ